MITEQDLELIEALLSEADEYGLTGEVVAFSLKEMKENPSLSVSEAIIIGYNEWIK